MPDKTAQEQNKRGPEKPVAMERRLAMQFRVRGGHVGSDKGYELRASQLGITSSRVTPLHGKDGRQSGSVSGSTSSQAI